MENYEKMEEELCEFKKYLKMVEDLMVDAYKWLKLSEYADSEESQVKFKRVGNTLFEMFMNEHNHIKEMFEKE